MVKEVDEICTLVRDETMPPMLLTFNNGVIFKCIPIHEYYHYIMSMKIFNTEHFFKAGSSADQCYARSKLGKHSETATRHY